MKTTIETVTPKIAAEYLQKVDPTHQRKLLIPRAEAFAREMTAGHWFTTHQGIGFDEQGRLIDGQHRLKAIELSGINIEMQVTRGIASEMVNGIRLFAIDTIDVGYKRGTGEQLTLRHGIENGNRVAAATRAILFWATLEVKNTTPVALEILNIYPNIKKLAPLVNKSNALNSALIACLAIATKTFPELLNSFVEPFVSGVELKRNSPALLLRNIILNNSSAGGGQSAMRIQMNWAFNALKAQALKDEIKQLKTNNIGWAFFKEHQKTSVRKIRIAAGLTETEIKQEEV